MGQKNEIRKGERISAFGRQRGRFSWETARLCDVSYGWNSARFVLESNAGCPLKGWVSLKISPAVSTKSSESTEMRRWISWIFEHTFSAKKAFAFGGWVLIGVLFAWFCDALFGGPMAGIVAGVVCGVLVSFSRERKAEALTHQVVVKERDDAEHNWDFECHWTEGGDHGEGSSTPREGFRHDP